MIDLTRTEMLIGQAGISRLKKSRVAVFGIGGVGSYTCEALARSGIGARCFWWTAIQLPQVI